MKNARADEPEGPSALTPAAYGGAFAAVKSGRGTKVRSERPSGRLLNGRNGGLPLLPFSGFGEQEEPHSDAPAPCPGAHEARPDAFPEADDPRVRERSQAALDD